MQLTTRGRYAVTAMVSLAMATTPRPVSLNQIAQDQHISLSYLEQLFANLREAKLVIGLRGPGGGYKLARPADSITIAQIIDAVNENVDVTQCGGMKNCAAGQPCLTHGLWDSLSHKLYDFLDGITLAELIQWPSVTQVKYRQDSTLLDTPMAKQAVTMDI